MIWHVGREGGCRRGDAGGGGVPLLGQAAWLFLEGCCLLLTKLWEVTYLKEKPEFWKNPKRSLVRSGVLRQ